MKLNKDFVERNLEKAEGICIFGIPLEDLTKEELIACMMATQNIEQHTREQHTKERDFLLNINRR